MATLSDFELTDALARLPGWERHETAITREYRFAGFPDAIAFVVRLAYDAEAADHHPDLDVRYNRVRVTLSTHSEGGVTTKDIDLARAVDLAARQ
jgi:4a-hydroxytetrahydrobiopterin dehydratase